MNHNHRHSAWGLSLPELLITSIVFVLVAGIVVRGSNASLRRGELNAAVVELSGWLETVYRETKSREIVTLSDRNASGGHEVICPITFTTGNALQAGTVLVRVPRGCAPGSPVVNNEDVFLLPGGRGGSTFLVRLLLGSATNNLTPPTFNYTPRGTTNRYQNLTLVISRQGDTTLRCLRIAPLLGTISLGTANNATGSNATCADNSFSDPI